MFELKTNVDCNLNILKYEHLFKLVSISFNSLLFNKIDMAWNFIFMVRGFSGKKKN